MHKLTEINSKLDQVLDHQQEAKAKWRHWGEKKKHWCKWFSALKKTDGHEQWNTAIGDWVNNHINNDTEDNKGMKGQMNNMHV